MENYKRIKSLFIILLVVSVGVGVIDLGFSILYKEELKAGSCELCFKLNPDIARCEFYSIPDINNITYEK